MWGGEDLEGAGRDGSGGPRPARALRFRRALRGDGASVALVAPSLTLREANTGRAGAEHYHLALLRLYILPANRSVSEARSAGLEPATFSVRSQDTGVCSCL